MKIEINLWVVIDKQQIWTITKLPISGISCKVGTWIIFHFANFVAMKLFNIVNDDRRALQYLFRIFVDISRESVYFNQCI